MFVGTDISKDTFDVRIRVGSDANAGKFANTELGYHKLSKWMQKHSAGTPHLVMEATGRYFEKLATWAVEQGWCVTVLNPRAVRQFAESRMKFHKSDKSDAEVLLRFGETGNDEELTLWLPKSSVQNALRDHQTEIAGLDKMIVQASNRLKCGIETPEVLESLRQTVEFLKQQKKILESAAKHLIKSDAKLWREYQVIDSAPGVGEVTARFLVSKIDFSMLKKGRQLVSLSGLAARTWESGTSVRKKTQISRTGHASLRRAMYMPALAALRSDPEMKAFAARLKAKGKSGKQIVCAVMCKLLHIIFSLVRDNRMYERRKVAV